MADILHITLNISSGVPTLVAASCERLPFKGSKSFNFHFLKLHEKSILLTITLQPQLIAIVNISDFGYGEWNFLHMEIQHTLHAMFMNRNLIFLDNGWILSHHVHIKAYAFKNKSKK
uniref:Uncharacterized protein n=1 Tax=Glossina pallidipes TaxID=7398 RepID=A0A1B0A0M3_GLOPL